MFQEEILKMLKKGWVNNMNKYVKEFFHRGLMFGGFGPIVAGTVFLILSGVHDNFSLGGSEVFLAIVLTYILAFVQAGVTVFNQIEHWSTPKSLFFHFTSLYITYTLCYVLNSWIPFKWSVIGIFTAIFAVLFFAIWITVYLSVRFTSKKMNSKLK
jgi:hypothetical protein